ncbi:pyridoxamine 5'-phosphate oxidase family protein [Streptomyces sp. LX-29]|uniref:pyridoxamine 5'-phosphate oxidase family protein n=1 Tax=Streptomyces sp. LX-29 TaxID=2900152 RepID=UPI00240D1F24|nr:pyridoxamine 5'-phosphate oxidase family protein [Streptomyces sp. LX-29]WFB08529.1 pyridoxamine 5'-phosphate oxidase family protein [Streptomyces sp. LX-29]
MPPDATVDHRAMALLARSPYGRLSVSMGALPSVTVTRHIVIDDEVVLRMHRGHGYHRACDGHVVAYGVDTVDAGEDEFWSVQCVGTARVSTPAPAELERFGAAPRTADGAPFEPVYLRVRPRFMTVHHIAGVPNRQPRQPG